jgi:3-hydroxyacyl-CoA dehydrogenase/enoyl-CoA hydratase/3-hydroxybutyryl-CoA epimerase
MIEAGQLFEAGASAEEIDAAMLDFGMPMGPLRLIDEVGVDIAEDVARTLAAAFPERLRVPAILPKMMQAGLLGRKTRKGFYLHENREATLNPGVNNLRTGSQGLTREELQRRMVLLMVNEAARCFEEGVVDSPADVDFGMVMGTGFAPFRGGPLRHADSLGTAKVAGDLAQLAETAGSHFAPCALLKSLNGKPFYED